MYLKGFLSVVFGLIVVVFFQQTAGSCSTKVTFQVNGVLDGAPLEELQACSACSCPNALSCDFCQYGINGYLCRPNGTIWCVGCNSTTPTTTTSSGTSTSSSTTSPAPCTGNCSQCIFAGPNNTKLCVPVTLDQYVGYWEGSVAASTSDKIILVNSFSAYSKSWLDAMSSIADATGASSLQMQFLNGNGVTPTLSAFQQLQYDAASLMQSSIVWSASLLQDSVQDASSVVNAIFAQGVQGQWLSAVNKEMLPPQGFVLPLIEQGVAPVDLTTLPVIPLQHYYGTCKTNMCAPNPNTIVAPINIIPIRYKKK